MVYASQAYVKLAEIAEQHRAQRIDAALVPVERPLWAGIRFLSQGRRLVCPVNEVAEVLVVPKMTPIPGVLPWMKGIANVRGRLLPIIDFSLYLFDESDYQRPHAKRLLVIEKGSLYCGLMVDEVLGRQHQSMETLIATDCVEPALRPYITGEFSSQDGEVWQIVSLVRLLESQHFLNAAL